MRPQVPVGGRRQVPPGQFEHELELARQVQRALLPSPLPRVTGIRLAAVSRPARIVSGDLYDAIVIDPERLAVLCADVSGEGLPRGVAGV